jgi:hypothetical protein
MSFLKTLEEYFKKNWKYIAIVVGALFLITAIVAIRGIEFKQNPNKQLEKIILYEKFTGREGMKNNEAAALEDGFCDRPADILEKSCRTLQEKGCKNSNCCIWGRPNTEMEDPGEDPITNPEGCYYGNENGAKFNNEKLNFDYWYYKGKDRDSAEKFTRHGNIKEGLENEELAEAFKKRTVVPPENKEPLKSAAAAAEIEKKQEESKEDAAENREQTAIRQYSIEDENRKMKHREESANLLLKHELDNEWAELKRRQAARGEIALMDKEAKIREEIDDAKDEVEKAQANADGKTVKKLVSQVIANNTGEGAAPTDLAEIAEQKVEASRAQEKAQESRLDLQTKERELAKIANKPVVQVAAEHGAPSNSRAKELAAAFTPQSVMSGGDIGAIVGGGGVKAKIAALNALKGKFNKSGAKEQGMKFLKGLF